MQHKKPDVREKKLSVENESNTANGFSEFLNTLIGVIVVSAMAAAIVWMMNALL